MKIFLLSIFILLLTASAFAQPSRQEIERIKQTLKDYDKRGLVWRYDQFRDETFIRTKAVGVLTTLRDVTISAAIRYKGQVAAEAPVTALLIIKIADHNWRQIKSDHQVRLLFPGGDVVTLGTANYDSHLGEYNESLTNESLIIAIKQSDLARMTTAKLISIQVGQMELFIKEKQLLSFQPLLDLLTGKP